MNDKILTLAEAAQYLGVENSTVHVLAGREIPIVYGPDRRRAVRQRDLDEYMLKGAYATLPKLRDTEPAGVTSSPSMTMPWYASIPTLEYPDQMPTITELIEPPCPANTLIHTENPQVVEWLDQRFQINGTVIYSDLLPSEVKGKHLITGMVPMYILAEALTITVIRAKGVFIGRATVRELEQAHAHLITYRPPAIIPSIWGK